MPYACEVKDQETPADLTRLQEYYGDRMSSVPSDGFERQAERDVFGRRPASPLEIQDMLDLSFLNRPPRPPKKRKGER